MATVPKFKANPLVEEAKEVIAAARGPEASFGAWEMRLTSFAEITCLPCRVRA